ncbi:hypothetical protein GQ457_02G023170 [Hibiscus cannabinus]
MENATHHETLVGIVFNPRDDAWEFYKDYAKNNGFNVCRSTTRHDVHGNVKAQGFCCTRGGVRRKGVADSERKRATRAITRIECKAKVIVKCTDSGGFHNAGFIRKDLYHTLQKTEAAELCDGDVNALLAYFEFKKEQDNGLCIQQYVDDSGGLHNLFWCDSTSRSNYACFGDAIAFDTTYKGNVYDRPLIPIVVLADETVDTFEWVLREFLEAMGKKPHVFFVTDGDRAMQRAIK